MAKKLTKIIGSVLLASTLMFGCYKGCSYSGPALPVTEETRETIQSQKYQKPKINYATSIDGLIEQYQNSITSGINEFNEGIKDGNYTLIEQERTLDKFDEAEKCLEKIAVLDKYRLNDPKIKLDEGTKSLNYQLIKNLRDLDIGTTELEKALYSQGLEVRVEGTAKPELGVIGVFSVLGLGLVGMGVAIAGFLKSNGIDIK